MEFPALVEKQDRNQIGRGKEGRQLLLVSQHQPCRAGEPSGPCLELEGPFLKGHLTQRVSSPGPAATACFCQGL